ncbi:MAG: type III-B CRISPR module RAMP protein Cmr6 [Candidatus Electrothrix sp. GM3_4]|nr:type III-B CRISPR module RAMP protein Cmr6 [Candidatus Electrothrix sp. GM3_4]
MSFQMIRDSLLQEKKTGKQWHNPSLFFDKGFEEWNEENSTIRGEDIGKHLEEVCNIPVSDVYKFAYRRWLGETANENHFARWFGQLDGTRLFIGLGMAHVLETQVCRHPVYGMPYIPGSALKGLARAKATEYARQKQYGITEDVVTILFGTGTDDQKADAGYLIFHDAWWIPGGKAGGCQQKPYIPEIVTVHAVEYYANQGKKEAPHPDMESPNPNHQIAVQGSFYFVIEGVQQWAKLGMKFLTLALEAEGIGGKVAAGYGYFEEDAKITRKNAETKMTPEERIRSVVDSWDIEKTLPVKIGKKYTKTKEELGKFGKDAWEIAVEYILEKHGDEIRSWKDELKNTAKRKAFNKLTQDKNEI